MAVNLSYQKHFKVIGICSWPFRTTKAFDVQLAKDKFNFEATTNLIDGLQKTIKCYIETEANKTLWSFIVNF